MSFVERMRRLKELGSRKGDLLDAIEINTLSRENLQAVREMVATEGWKMYEHQLRSALKNKSAKLEELAIEPETNKYPLAWYGASCAVIRKQLAWVDNILGRAEQLNNERNRLQQVAMDNNNQERAI